MPNALAKIFKRFCSTNFTWNKNHLNTPTSSSWRENPNRNIQPIKRGEKYYPARTLKVYPHDRRRGYKINWFNGGYLPRVPTNAANATPLPPYKPNDAWTPEKVYMGRNDYIDILGDTDIQHVDLVDKGPYWVRGVPRKWNELQWLIRKDKFVGDSLASEAPERYRLMQTRMKFLYNYYNVKLAGREGKYKRRYRG